MKVSVKLMASLRGCLPPDCKGGAVTLDLDDGASVETVLQRLGIAQGLVHLVMHPTAARSPGLKLRTAEPTFVTRPTIS